MGLDMAPKLRMAGALTAGKALQTAKSRVPAAGHNPAPYSPVYSLR